MLEQWTEKLCLGYPSRIAGFNPGAHPAGAGGAPHPSTCTVRVQIRERRDEMRRDETWCGAARRDATRRVNIDAKVET